MNEDGTMARRPQLEVFAERHGLRIGTIADLIAYRALHDQTVLRRHDKHVDTAFGGFRLVSYEDLVDGSLHVARSRARYAPKTRFWYGCT